MEKRIKKTLICADVANFNIDQFKTRTHVPQVGDVAVFEVKSIGKHKQVQAADKRNAAIMPGDLIMAAFGTRYATAQFEGYVPEEVMDEYHILGAGGTIGIVHSMNAQFTGPTTLRMVGYATDENYRIINTKQQKAKQMIPFAGAAHKNGAKVIVSIGSSMDSGKTTTAGYLVKGFKNAGKKAVFIKLTGTIYSKDCDFAFDMGADVSIDFGAFGFPSTFLCTTQELLDLHESLIQQVSHVNPDYIVIEIADGIYQRETKMLLTNPAFMDTVNEVVFSCGDSLSAVHGVGLLKNMDIQPLALSGLMTASPLLVTEAKEHIDIPVFTIDEIAKGAVVSLLQENTIGTGSEGRYRLHAAA
jgi:hypothetical protein